MVNLSPIAFLSIGYTLLVVALNLAFLKYEMGGGKNLRRRGLCIMGIGVVVAIVAWFTLSGQEWDVFRTTAIAIALTGLIPALRGTIQKEKSEKKRKTQL
jgi:uncharacterized membrane protein